MLKGIIIAKGFKRLLLIILGLFLFFSFVSAAVLYYSLQVPLSPHYGAAITVITQVKESLVIETININFIFYLATAIGVALLGVFYSHRIAGPLFKVKQHAAVLGEGRFDKRIHFRKKDVIHDLSSTLNEMALAYQDRTRRLTAGLKELEEGILLSGSLSGKSKEKIELIKKLRDLDTRIKEDHQGIKL